MTEEEIEKAVDKHARRFKTFVAEGLNEKDAWDLADKMWERDADIGDNRRVCFECKNYVDRKCIKLLDKYNKPMMPARFILWRCPKFILKGKP